MIIQLSFLTVQMMKNEKYSSHVTEQKEYHTKGSKIYTYVYMRIEEENMLLQSLVFEYNISLKMSFFHDFVIPTNQLTI